MSLQTALQEHFETALAPAAADREGVAMMGFPAFDGHILRGAVELTKAWLRDALNSGLMPSKQDVHDMAKKLFDQFAAPRIPDFLDEAAEFYFLHLIDLAYDQIVTNRPKAA